MMYKRRLTLMLLAACLSGSSAYGQGVLDQRLFPPPSPTLPKGEPEYVPGPLVPSVSGLSDWIRYERACCEGEEGRRTPFYTEVYVASGVTFPVGGMTLSGELKPGWSIMGGARGLFFNESHSRAWAVDLHVINTNETAGKRNTQFPVNFAQNGIPQIFNATLQDFTRTSFGLGVGREWYPWEPAHSDGHKWRLGVDMGGRWGSGRVNFDQTGHLTDVLASMYVAGHSDLEIPCHRCVFQAGLRFEWAYTWSDVLQRVSDLQELSLMVRLGVRY